MKRWYQVLWLVAFTDAPAGTRQPPEVAVESLARITTDASDADHAEVWLATSPLNPRDAVVGVLSGSGDRSSVYQSADGGRSWVRSRHGGPQPAVFEGGDPHVVFTATGRPLFSTISPLRVWRRIDATRWDGPIVVPGRAYDRQFLAATRQGDRVVIHAMGKSPIQVHGHLTQDVLGISTSTDSGRTFSQPRLVLPDPTREIIQAPSSLLAIGSQVLVFYNAHDVPVTDMRRLSNGLMLTISRDGGREFSPPVRVASFTQIGNAAGDEPMLKGLAAGGSAIDTSSASRYRGRLYATWLDQTPRGSRVMISSSADTGRTWATPREVAPSASTGGQSNPGIAVGSRGSVAVVWNDRRDDAADRCFRTMIALSGDGAETFAEPRALGRTSVCPVPAGERVTSETFRGRYLQGGETQGIAPVADDRFLVAWIDALDGRMQVHASEVRIR